MNNKGKGLAPGDRRHGTPSGYSYFGCHCEQCARAYHIKETRNRALRKVSK